MAGSGDLPDLAVNLANFALWDVETGNATRAKESAQKALAANPGIATRKVLALVLARAGDVDHAEQMANNVARESPVSTFAQNYQLPTIRAAIELNAGRAKEAIEILKVSAPFELAEPEIIYGPFGGLYPCYIRGLAYLKLNEGKPAAAEFQKLVDHPGLGLGYPTGPLSHLQLGRAQVMMGDKTAARKSYQDFLSLWKDADPDSPIYKQAKAEYAKLQ
jgi:tetratricopeptide (TPR) repeat protein